MASQRQATCTSFGPFKRQHRYHFDSPWHLCRDQELQLRTISIACSDSSELVSDYKISFSMEQLSHHSVKLIRQKYSSFLSLYFKKVISTQTSSVFYLTKEVVIRESSVLSWFHNVKSSIESNIYQPEITLIFIDSKFCNVQTCFNNFNFVFLRMNQYFLC